MRKKFSAKIFKLKKFSVLLLLLLVPLASAADVGVKLLNMEPSPATAGTFFTVNFEATNNGNETINFVEFKLKTPKYFVVQEDKNLEYSDFKAGKKVQLTWLVKVGKDASAGFDRIELDVDEDGDDSNYYFPVQIKNFEPTLTISDAQTTPLQVAPGNKVIVDLTLENQASFLLKNVQVKLGLSNLPFAPSEGIEEQTLKELLNPQKLSFKLSVNPDAEAGVYKVPVMLNYFDEFGNSYSKSNLISIKVGSTPKLEISQESSTLLVGKKEEATIKLVNNGLTKVKLLTVTIQAINAELLSSNNVYIGDLDVDDFQTIDMDLFPQSKETQLKLTLSFKDANNKEFKETVTLPIKVYTDEEAKALGLVSQSNLFVYLAIIVVLIVAYVFYKKIRKK
ncbi:hypothetical protein HZA97_04310 [Candidatus Woesearchaeota archaeon]|nr:hypothetical protein [Candidatus Woesearchaeota archaeon]